MQTAFEAFQVFRADMKAQLGSGVIKALHQQKAWLDWLVFTLITCLFFFLMYALYVLPISLLWVVCLIVQGFVMQGFGFFAHDVFTHRKVGGRKLGYLCELFATIPYFRLPSQYLDLHTRHHRYLNTEQDPEVQTLMSLRKLTRVKKFLMFTIVGAYITILRGANNKKSSDQFIPKIKREKLIRIVYIFSILLLTLAFPAILLNGYWLPILTTLPIITGFRILLEHAEVDPSNPIQAATNYRSGIVFKILHAFDSGDCHLIHHIYPNIPFYHMTKAVKLLRPYLRERYSVYEHKSLLMLLFKFFIKNKKFKESWVKKAFNEA